MGVAVTRAQRLDHLEAEAEAVNRGRLTFGDRIDRMPGRPLVSRPPLTS
jgi:hypothetical protein